MHIQHLYSGRTTHLRWKKNIPEMFFSVKDTKLGRVFFWLVEMYTILYRYILTINFLTVIIRCWTGGGGSHCIVLFNSSCLVPPDEADVCGSASSPKTISLTTDYPVASLATPNFPSNYPEGAVCYTNIDSPDGYNVMVNYIAADIVNLADYFFIYNLINPSSPILLRAETTGFLSASQLGSRSFDTRTSALHTVFSDTGTTENPGILVVFSAVPGKIFKVTNKLANL